MKSLFDIFRVTESYKLPDKIMEALLSDQAEKIIREVAYTMLKNAKRDGTEFAWIPNGTACPYCLELASRGWRPANENTVGGGHAEHIHAHCDCQYAVRFDGKSTVAGYDPDKYLAMYENAGGDINAMRRKRYEQNKDEINARKRELYAAQAYRKVERGTPSKISLARNGAEVSIPVKRIDSYNTPIYISDKAEIKPKALNSINQNTEKALKNYGIPIGRKPTVVILSDDELKNALGLYDPCSNIVYYSQSISNPEVQRLVGGKGAVERHEMWHMKQAEDFKNSGGKITRGTRGEYLQKLCKKCKNNIDNYGITKDNVNGISSYAEFMYKRGRYDEVEAEFITLKGKKVH